MLIKDSKVKKVFLMQVYVLFNGFHCAGEKNTMKYRHIYFILPMVGQVIVSPSLAQFGEIRFTYPEFAIIVAIGLLKP
jgi:hypothetical protein